MRIKYFKVTSDRLNSPMYYAAYNLDDAKEVVYSDFNSQFVCEFEEIKYKDIPVTSIIHTAKLEFVDSRAVSRRLERLANA